MTGELQPQLFSEEVKPIEPVDQKLQDRISRYQNSNQPKYPGNKEPGPSNIYVNRKGRRKKTRADVHRKADAFLAARALNTRKMTPLDEFPELGYDHE